MPKRFPPAPGSGVIDTTNVHPAAVESPTDPLCDLLFDHADQVVIADYLRTNFDEPNGKLMAAWLALLSEYIPSFQRAVINAEDATYRRIKAEELVSQMRLSRPANFSVEGLATHRAMIADLEGEMRVASLLDDAKAHATAALLVIGGVAPALWADSRSREAAEQPLPLEEITQRRLAIQNYPSTHKLEVEVVDGWPRSIHKMYGTAGRVVIRTVERVPKGLRLPS